MTDRTPDPVREAVEDAVIQQHRVNAVLAALSDLLDGGKALVRVDEECGRCGGMGEGVGPNPHHLDCPSCDGRGTVTCLEVVGLEGEIIWCHTCLALRGRSCTDQKHKVSRLYRLTRRRERRP